MKKFFYTIVSVFIALSLMMPLSALQLPVYHLDVPERLGATAVECYITHAELDGLDGYQAILYVHPGIVDTIDLKWWSSDEIRTVWCGENERFIDAGFIDAEIAGCYTLEMTLTLLSKEIICESLTFSNDSFASTTDNTAPICTIAEGLDGSLRINACDNTGLNSISYRCSDDNAWIRDDFEQKYKAATLDMMHHEGSSRYIHVRMEDINKNTRSAIILLPAASNSSPATSDSVGLCAAAMALSALGITAAVQLKKHKHDVR